MSGSWGLGAWCLGQDMANLGSPQHRNLLSLPHFTLNCSAFCSGIPEYRKGGPETQLPETQPLLRCHACPPLGLGVGITPPTRVFEDMTAGREHGGATHVLFPGRTMKKEENEEHTALHYSFALRVCRCRSEPSGHGAEAGPAPQSPVAAAVPAWLGLACVTAGLLRVASWPSP